MNEIKLEKIDKLIKIKKIREAEFELSKLGPEFFKNTEYLYLRSKIFFANKLYYMALDALLIATEFDVKEKIKFTILLLKYIIYWEIKSLVKNSLIQI